MPASDRITGARLVQGGFSELAIGYLEHEPDPVSRLNLAIAYRHTNRLPQAQSILVDLCKNDDTPANVFAAALNSLGMVHADLGRFTQSEAAFQCAYDLMPGQQVALNLGYAKLRLQKFEEAWPYFESGRLGSSWRLMDGTRPWEGQLGNAICVSEGGFGDGFLFDRFLYDFVDSTNRAHLSIWSQMESTGYWKSRPGDYFTVSYHSGDPFQGIPAEKWEFTTSIMSLMAILGMKSVVDIPQARKPSINGGFDRNLTPSGGIGLCWAAEENGVIRKHRSIPVEDLSPLADMDRKYYSLVPGQCPTWANPVPIRSWADTMSILLGLDLVISVDTAVAHLACLMGVPTIIVLPTRSDWKWFVGTDRSPWWPSATLVRNTDPVRFGPAIQRVMEMI